MRSGFEFRAADISDLPHRSDILLIDFNLCMSVRQPEKGRARCRDYLKLLTPQLLVSRNCFAIRATRSNKILPGDWNRLFNASRLLHERIRRNIDITMHACFAAEAQIIPGCRLRNARLSRIPFSQRFFDRRIVGQRGGSDLSKSQASTFGWTDVAIAGARHLPG